MHLCVGGFEAREIIRRANTGKGEKEKGRTSDEIELFDTNCFVLNFPSDAIFGNIRHVGTEYRIKNPGLLTAIE
jgi:hypothetical protein